MSRPLAVFRVDASYQIGTGHVMRCLTLADALRDTCDVTFICADLAGHQAALITEKQFAVKRLPRPISSHTESASDDYQAWLGVSQQQDAMQTLAVLQSLDREVDWLIVDHYAMDQAWSQFIKQAGSRVQQLMVIDDLANRMHDCDVLLDQNLGRQASDYQPYVPATTRLLVDPDYTLLRREFRDWRPASLERRDKAAQIGRILISLGGVDLANDTSRVLAAIEQLDAQRFAHIQFTIVLGASAPHIEVIAHQIERLSAQGWRMQCVVSPPSMAELMAQADYAICAAGSTTWERCAMGLPALTLLVAANQQPVATVISRFGHVLKPAELQGHLSQILSALTPESLQAESQQIRQLIDGQGAERVARILLSSPKIAK